METTVSRKTFSEVQLTTLIGLYEAGMVTTKRPDLIEQASAKTGLEVTTIKTWIGNYSKKVKGKRYNRKKTTFTKGRSGFNEYCSEKKDVGKFSDWAKSWNLLSPKEKETYKEKAKITNGKMQTGVFSSQPLKQQAIRDQIKKLGEITATLEKLGVECFSVGMINDDMPFYSASQKAMKFLEINGLENKFSSFMSQESNLLVTQANTPKVPELRQKVRELLNKLYSTAIKKNKPFPYKLLEMGLLSVSGLPEEISLHDPSAMGEKALRAILDNGTSMGVTLHSGPIIKEPNRNLEIPQARESELAEKTEEVNVSETTDSEPEPDPELAQVVLGKTKKTTLKKQRGPNRQTSTLTSLSPSKIIENLVDGQCTLEEVVDHEDLDLATNQQTASQGSQGGAKRGRPRKRKQTAFEILHEMSRGGCLELTSIPGQEEQDLRVTAHQQTEEGSKGGAKRGRAKKRKQSAPVILNEMPKDNTEDNIFSVEKIIKTRIKKRRKEVLVKWQGYPASRNTWEPIENINKTLIKEFESNKTSGKPH